MPLQGNRKESAVRVWHAFTDLSVTRRRDMAGHSSFNCTAIQPTHAADHHSQHVPLVTNSTVVAKNNYCNSFVKEVLLLRLSPQAPRNL